MGVYHASVSGAGCSFILGYVLDTAAGAPVGIHTLVNTLVFSMSAMLSKSLWTNNVASVLAMVGCGILLKALTAAFLYEADWTASVLLGFFRQHTVWDLIISLGLPPVVFLPLVLFPFCEPVFVFPDLFPFWPFWFPLAEFESSDF